MFIFGRVNALFFIFILSFTGAPKHTAPPPTHLTPSRAPFLCILRPPIAPVYPLPSYHHSTRFSVIPLWLHSPFPFACPCFLSLTFNNVVRPAHVALKRTVSDHVMPPDRPQDKTAALHSDATPPSFLSSLAATHRSSSTSFLHRSFLPFCYAPSYSPLPNIRRPTPQVCSSQT